MGLFNHRHAIEGASRPQRRWIVFIEQHKGDLTLALSAVFYLSSWMVLRLERMADGGRVDALDG